MLGSSCGFLHAENAQTTRWVAQEISTIEQNALLRSTCFINPNATMQSQDIIVLSPPPPAPKKAATPPTATADALHLVKVYANWYCIAYHESMSRHKNYIVAL